MSARLLAFLFSALIALGVNAAPTSPFQMQGKTVTFTAAASPPATVQAVGDGNTSPMQYVITNTGSVNAFVSCESTSALATSNAAIPTAGTPVRVYPVFATSQVVLTCAPGAFLTGITASSTAVIYVTPGEGL